MPIWIAIALGGAAGALLRYASVSTVSSLLQKWDANLLPWGILLVNVVGSFALGCAFVWFHERANASGAGHGTNAIVFSEPFKLAVTVGFLGALTTFSTFALDTVNLFLLGEWLRGIANVLLNVLLCCAAVWLAFYWLKPTAALGTPLP